MKKYICHIHDDIEYLCNDINNLLDDEPIRIKKIKSKIDKIISYINTARENGISMEKRLQDYRFTIESLGFKKEKK